MIGLYAIVNLVNGKAYVGSSHNVKARMTVHKSNLKRGKHHNSHLQSAWVKYGESSFDFREIKSCATERESAELEQGFLECFFGDGLYNQKNMAFGVGSGRSHPNKGKSLSDEHKLKISISLKGVGRPHSQETKETMSRKLTKYLVASPDGVFIGLSQAARFYGVTETTIRNWCGGKCAKDGFRKVEK